MWRYIVKRLLLIIPILLGVTFLIFTIMYFTPGDPATIILQGTATQDVVDALNHELGYDRPFLTRYFNFLSDILRGDFGQSYTSRLNVMDEILSRFPRTLRLATFSMILTGLVGISIGILSAVKQYTIVDNIFSVFSMFFSAVPGFWISMTLLLIFSMNLKLFPINGVETWQGYVLPIISLTLSNSAPIMRLTRSTMLETIRSDYIRTARAKGARERRVIWSHAFKNALLPVVTVLGTNFAHLLGGSVICETVFVIPGLGSYLVSAIRNKDVPVVMGCTLFMATLFCIVVLVVDVLYAYIDPRVKAKYTR